MVRHGFVGGEVARPKELVWRVGECGSEGEQLGSEVLVMREGEIGWREWIWVEGWSGYGRETAIDGFG